MRLRSRAVFASFHIIMPPCAPVCKSILRGFGRHTGDFPPGNRKSAEKFLKSPDLSKKGIEIQKIICYNRVGETAGGYPKVLQSKVNTRKIPM
ncbi:MAG: hypothetical protein J6I98_04810 [Clostridia bacterium]|nr:hypothetical protein [Clostridia bacterium]